MDETINENETMLDTETGEIYEAPAGAEMVLSNAGASLVRSLESENTTQIFGCNFDPESKEGIVRVFNAQENGDSLSESKLTELVLDGILIQPGVRVDPVSGTRTACANTVLLTHDGQNLVSQSNGIARTAARIVALYEKLGWPEEGVAVNLIEQKLDRGRTYKKLVLA